MNYKILKIIIFTNIIVYLSITIVIFFYHGIKIENFIKSFYLYILLYIGAFISFLNILDIKSYQNILSFILWLLLIIFIFCIFKLNQRKESISQYKIFFLFLIFFYMCIFSGMYNPQFRA